MKTISRCILLVLLSPVYSTDHDFEGLGWNGWQPFAPRDEISPSFSVLKNHENNRKVALVIKHDSRENLYGAWSKTFDVKGGMHYLGEAFARTKNVENPRTSRFLELFFHDEDGKYVTDERIGVPSRPLYPWDDPKTVDGWSRFSGVFKAPMKATHATLRLCLRWAPNGYVEWENFKFNQVAQPKSRNVRLAAVNFRPRGGKSALDNCKMLEPFVQKAAKGDADLVVFGECITTMNNGLDHESGAEEVPGPCTDYLGSLSSKYELYLVTSLFERSGHNIYNTAIMLGPDGSLVGSYRKLCLARGEYRRGIAPGADFPVFETTFGKVGMMICFDVHMPEVARGIAARGAEIIAMPIMGGHPTLAQARAIENQVYLVTSTYSLNEDWMQTGIWDTQGKLHSRATQPNEVVFHEVDLAKRNFWRANIGDFRGRLRHERPPFKLPQN